MIRRSRFHQRGMLCCMGVRRQAWADGSSYTLDAGNGGTVTATDGSSPYNTFVGIRFLTTGAVEICENVDGGPSWASHGSWISDVGQITGNEEVRFTNLVVNSGPGNWSTEAAADDTWIGITVTREWYNNRTTANTWDFDCDFEVRDTTVSGLATGSSSYSFILDNVV